jgi:hypothetical protein
VIEINSVAIATPSSFAVKIRDIKKEDYNANGNIIIEIKSKKRDIELSYNYLAQSESSTLLTALAASTTFSVSYPDPETGATRTGTFFCRDRNVGMIDFQGSVARYKDITLSLGEV